MGAQNLEAEFELAKETLWDVRTEPWSEEALPTLRRLHQESPRDFFEVLHVLADGSRHEARREAYGETGLLDYFLQLQATVPDKDVRRECLRAIANACADIDSNRDRVISSPYLSAILENLFDELTTYVALAALYNFSLDYDPAQHALREKGLFLKLIALLDEPMISQQIRGDYNQSSMLHHTTGLLSFAIEDYDVDRSPDSVLKTLLRCVTHGDPELEEIVSLRNAVSLHLKHDRFRQFLFEQDLFETLLVSILRSFGYTGSLKTRLPEAYTSTLPPNDEMEDLQLLQTSLIAMLRDLTSSLAFFRKYPFESGVTRTYFSWLKSDNSNLQLIACCILSNYARATEQQAEQIVVTYNAHLRLIDICVQEPESPIALAALELLLQLARPHDNRARICSHEFLAKTSRIWQKGAIGSGGLIRTQYGSIAVLLGLLSDCPQAVQRFVCRSPSELAKEFSKQHLNYLKSLLLLFSRSNDKKVSIEIAKVVVEISKTIARIGPLLNDSEKALDTRSWKVQNIWHDCLGTEPTFLTPIPLIISRSADTGLQAQGYFTLVIVGRLDLGVTMVRDVMQQRHVFEHLVQVVSKQPVGCLKTGQEPPENIDRGKWAVIQRSVHENARCLVKEVAERKDPQLSHDWLDLLSDLFYGRFVDTSHFMDRAMPFLNDSASSEGNHA